MLDVILLILCAVAPAIVLHEYAHGLVANLCGDPTAKMQGRLTLNPIKHIDPIGSVLIPGGLFLLHYFGITKSLILFGWAKPVPVNFAGLRHPHRDMALVALAGPAVNVVLAWLYIQLLHWSVLSGSFYILGWGGILFNLTLAVFNMMPIPPLDGSRVVMGLLPRPLARQYAKLEPFGFLIVVVLLQLGMLQFLYPLISALGALLGIQI